MSDIKDILKDTFGFNDFREGQKEIIDSILSDKSTIVVKSTGFGKTLCFQLPHMYRPRGLVIVVSPLVALMIDQVNKSPGVSYMLNRTVYSFEKKDILEELKLNKVDYLYLSPEQLYKYKDIILKLKIDYVVIDEAHCIDLWSEFRLFYTKIRECIPLRVPIHLFSASLPDQSLKFVLDSLKISDYNLFKGSIYKSNLRLSILNVIDKDSKVLEYVKSYENLKGIIYCNTISDCKNLSKFLLKEGISNYVYYSKVDDRDKEKILYEFKNTAKLLICTNAFGMGVDIPDIRYVIHYSLPVSVLDYYQEIGRAGRDGLDSDCIVLYTENDRVKGVFQTSIFNGMSHRPLKTDECRCRWRTLGDYFGESLSDCGTCDVCKLNRYRNVFKTR